MNNTDAQTLALYLPLLSGVVVILLPLAGVLLLWGRRRKILHEIQCMESAHVIVCTKAFDDWSDSERQTVSLACLMSAYRNSTRGNNVCQSLASLFRKIYSTLEAKGVLTEHDINTLKNHINYWAWSLGEGERPKLFSLPR